MIASPDERLERNKRAVVEFYDLMFNQCRPAEAIERYAGATYTQHNPAVRTGRPPSSPTSSEWRGNTLASEWSSSE
jgi:hypothetical protein